MKSCWRKSTAGGDAGSKVHVLVNTPISHRTIGASTIQNTLLDNSTETLTVYLHFWLIPVAITIIINEIKE